MEEPDTTVEGLLLLGIISGMFGGGVPFMWRVELTWMEEVGGVGLEPVGGTGSDACTGARVVEGLLVGVFPPLLDELATLPLGLGFD